MGLMEFSKVLIVFWQTSGGLMPRFTLIVTHRRKMKRKTELEWLKETPGVQRVKRALCGDTRFRVDAFLEFVFGAYVWLYLIFVLDLVNSSCLMELSLQCL